MRELTRIHPEAQTWDDFVAAHPHGNVLQTTRWGRLKDGFGWEWELVALGEGGEIAGGAVILYRRLPLNLGALAYLPRGPVVDWSDRDLAAAVVDTVEGAARERGTWALWAEPELADGEGARELLRDLGLREGEETIQPPRTIVVDIDADEDEILARMKSKTRYNIRLSGRKGVTVRRGDLDDLGTLYALMEETGERNEFGIHSRAYYRRALELFVPEHGALLLAEVEGEAVAAIIVFALGEKAWYFYGASSSRHRKKMPTYALQWAAVQWAKGRGCTGYDLWGVPDYDEEALEENFLERSEGLWGVYRFKRGFGGDVMRFVGLWERPLHPLYTPAARLRSFLERIRD
jgi:lipid II:glycine glycyltransferase (peptidoglycan interpeptide bridge formation enzyme)